MTELDQATVETRFRIAEKVLEAYTAHLGYLHLEPEGTWEQVPGDDEVKVYVVGKNRLGGPFSGLSFTIFRHGTAEPLFCIIATHEGSTQETTVTLEVDGSVTLSAPERNRRDF